MILPYVYDAGALIALDRGERSAWARHLLAVEEARRVLVPAVVVAQVWRGGARQHDLGRLLRSCEVISIDDSAARHAGQLCGHAHTSDVVDALVLVTALANGPGVIWTSDPDDLGALRRASSQAADVLIRTV